jgi:phosphopantothenoylcysteine decarboxylase/phosphopantothenate--cysteine ligase
LSAACALSDLAGKKIILGVTGGIAGYKAAELARLLARAGAAVHVAMTRAATQFVAPLTFQALTGNPVHLELLDAGEESAMGHIRLARWADMVVVAPASADFIAKLRVGIADDLLTTLCLAATVPIAIAPAMNQAMWGNPATRENIACLEQRGRLILGPAEGEQACGEMGPGRMLEPPEIADRLGRRFAPGLLSGLSVLVTAGPTHEAIDPVRYVGNRSSGKMGYAIAGEAARMNARVALVTGPTALAAPPDCETVRVEAAEAMYQEVMARAQAADIFIGAAAVADYRPKELKSSKIKKTRDDMTLDLCKTKDILAAVARLGGRPFTVGFAAETEELETRAREKLAAKSVGMVAGNLVGPGSGFGTDDNALFVCWKDGEIHLPRASKQTLARQLLELVVRRYHAANPA